MNIEAYKKVGKEIVETYCISDEANEPMMCPPAPNLSPYIDKFQGQLSKDNLDDQQRQKDYETEVMVYRALEGLEENIFVLHSFEYTRGQYKLFVEGQKMENKFGPNNREGETDFLVIGRNYFAIIEVKNKEHVGEDLPGPGCNRQTQINALKDIFNKSQDQCAKTKTLIEKIIDCVGGDEDSPILHFSAFPNFKKEFISEFELDKEKKRGIICKEDFDCFDKWWKDNVTDHEYYSDSVSHPVIPSHMIDSAVSHVLLAVWCYEQKKNGKYEYNKTKFSLRECIRKTDEQLINAEITQKRKNAKTDKRCKNQAVDPAPPIFKDYLGVQNLSNQQHQVFNSKQKLLWINGSAGSGKTIIILVKIIELAKAESKTIIVIKPSPSPHYHKTLQKAGVTSTEIILHQSDLKKRDFNSQQYVEKSISRLTEQVVLIQFIPTSYSFTTREMENISGIITTVENACHVFIDDTQVLFRDYSYSHSSSSRVLVTLLTKLRARANAPTDTVSMVWWACDIVQVGTFYTADIAGYSDTLQRVLTSDQLITLSDNLRNTCDISKMVSVIRDIYIKRQGTRRDVSLVPHEDNGHFIHGPRPVIHVVYDDDEGSYMGRVSQIAEKELKKLCGSDGGERDIGLIVHEDVREATAARLRKLDIVKCNPCIEVVSGTDKSYSVEWPAVLVVAELEKVRAFYYSRWLSHMYILLSRGRVYCSAVLIARPNKGDHELLDRLKPFARIKHYK